MRRTRNVWIPWLGLFCMIAVVRCGRVPEPQRSPLARAILHIGDSPTYDFGLVPVGEGREVFFTVTNAGSVAATDMQGDFYLSLNFSYVGGDYPGLNGDCGEQLAPSAQCTLHVGFAPQYESTFQAAIEIQYFDGEKPQVTSQPILTGRGTTP